MLKAHAIAGLLAFALVATQAASAAEEGTAALGRALFERDWVTAPGSADASGGLGPLYAARSCAGCHAGPALSGRFTEAPERRIASRGLVLRFADGAGNPDPFYGHALQSQAAAGLTPEGRAVLTASADALRGYVLSLHLAHGALGDETRQSPRLAPALLGRAALERIDTAAVMARADPDDRDGDGISGRAAMIVTDSGEVLGRYGWKAEIATLKEQIADAFALDMGLSSTRRPRLQGDCTPRQTACLASAQSASSPGDHEITEAAIVSVAAYLESLPLREPPSDETAGARLFTEIGCAACHVPRLRTQDGQTVASFTDLLLHDMGPDLDDGVGAPGVASSEWRTAPLVAMQPIGGRRYLHDGRAATIDAAIRAHAGEAAAARARYGALSEAERDSLAAFVSAL